MFVFLGLYFSCIIIFFFVYMPYKIVTSINRLFVKGKRNKGWFFTCAALLFSAFVVWQTIEAFRPSDYYYKDQFEAVFSIPFPKCGKIIDKENYVFDLHGKGGFRCGISVDKTAFDKLLSYFPVKIYIVEKNNKSDSIETSKMWAPYRNKQVIADYVKHDGKSTCVLQFMNDRHTLIFHELDGLQWD